VTLSVIYQGPFYNLSGYAAESRGLAWQLVQQGIEVQIRHVGPASPKELDPEEYARFKRLEEQAVDPDRSLLIVADPPMWSRRPAAPLAVIRTMFETERLRPEWVENCARYDEVWVPSTHNQEAFIASGLKPDQVKVIRGGIDTGLFQPGVEPLALPRRKAFAFLSVFDWHWRKGWDLLLRAYGEEFDPGEPVTLYLKVNQIGQRTAIVSEVDYLLRTALDRTFANMPEIVIIDCALSDAEMTRLYAAVDAFVLPSRGEGYGRPFLEAMACGLPVIGTAWGGQTDFLSHEVGYPVAITGLEAVSEFEPRAVYRGLRWAAPDVQALRRILRHVYTHPEEARQKGEAGRLRAVAEWDYGVVAADMARQVARLLG
jgi:glycosyltransferase involved in cell wall biosynthesis